MTSTKVFNLVRALNKPYPGAFYVEKNKIIRIFKCKKIKNQNELKAGEILHKKNKKIIKCKYGSIEILKKKESK